MIENSNKFNARISPILDLLGEKKVFRFQLFNDWSVYGDGMALTEYKVIGILDTKAENPYIFGQE